jgi:hypothetical protein
MATKSPEDGEFKHQYMFFFMSLAVHCELMSVIFLSAEKIRKQYFDVFLGQDHTPGMENNGSDTVLNPIQCNEIITDKI